MRFYKLMNPFIIYHIGFHFGFNSRQMVEEGGKKKSIISFKNYNHQ
jgi:hypothetical protein